jgi:protein SCO1
MRGASKPTGVHALACFGRETAKARRTARAFPGGVTRELRALALIAGLGVGAAMAKAQYRADHIPDGPPVAVANPEIVEKSNAIIPQELEFTRSDGKKVKLGELFNHNRPVILSLVYFSCPNLCGYAQDDLVNAVRSGPRSLVIGKDYDIVVVSIDPDDTPAAAAAKRQKYVALMGKPQAEQGVTYLTGTRENIRQLADTVGFGFRENFGVKADDPAGKFAHSAGVFVCTPYGRLSQTIRGLNWPTDKLHYALLQASDGKIGSGFLETVGLACGAVRLGPHGYEHNPWFWAGTAGAGGTIVFMAIFLGLMWRGEWKRKTITGDLSGGQGDQVAGDKVTK